VNCRVWPFHATVKADVARSQQLVSGSSAREIKFMGKNLGPLRPFRLTSGGLKIHGLSHDQA